MGQRERVPKDRSVINNWARQAPALVARVLQELVFFVYPPSCAGCGRHVSSAEAEGFCADCQRALELIEEPYCPLCGMPYLVEAPGVHLCGDCITGAYRFQRARAAGVYRGLLREVLHRFKYQGQIYLARPLARLLLVPARNLCAVHTIDLMVPVPLHRRRLRQRGFNQAALLAGRLGSSLGVPVHYDILRRSRWTEPQIGLSRSQRAANVRGAFQLAGPEKVRGKNVLVLDDVLTTGETVNQCARVLRDGGAREVVLVTVARTVSM